MTPVSENDTLSDQETQPNGAGRFSIIPKKGADLDRILRLDEYSADVAQFGDSVLNGRGAAAIASNKGGFPICSF